MSTVRNLAAMKVFKQGVCSLLLALVLLLFSYPAMVTQAATILKVGAGFGGLYTSLALDSSGIPLISYQDQNVASDLALVRCNSPTLCNAPTVTIVDNTANFSYTSLALDSNDIPVISYFDIDNGDLKLARCNSATNCDTPTIRTIDSTLNVGLNNSLELDSSDRPIISYVLGTSNTLKIAFCDDPTCSSSTTKVLDPDNVLGNTSLELDSAGNPVVSHRGGAGGNLRLTICSDPACNSVTIRTVDSGNSTGSASSLALDSSDIGSIAYLANGNLKFARCNDATCSSPTLQTLDNGNVGGFASLGLTSAGLPFVAYYMGFVADLKLASCSDVTCTSPTLTTLHDIPNQEVGSWTSLVIDDDVPVISYLNSTLLDLMLYNGHNNLPTMVKNNPVNVTSGSSITIGNAMLLTTDSDNAPPQTLTYSVVSAPTKGTLNLGSTFTQTQVDSSSLSYTFTGVGTDTFAFTVFDGEATIGPFAFIINPLPPSRNYYIIDTPTLTWNTITWAAEYEIQVDNTATFATTLEFTATVPASSLAVTTTPLAEGTYYWRVRAKNGSTIGSWSAVESFSIDLP